MNPAEYPTWEWKCLLGNAKVKSRTSYLPKNNINGMTYLVRKRRTAFQPVSYRCWCVGTTIDSARWSIWQILIKMFQLGTSHSLLEPFLECWKFLATPYSVVMFIPLAKFFSCVRWLAHIQNWKGLFRSRISMSWVCIRVTLDKLFILRHCTTLRTGNKVNVCLVKLVCLYVISMSISFILL